MTIDGQGREARGSCAGREPVIQAGDTADTRAGQVRHDAGEVIGPDHHVAVGQDHDFVPDIRLHVDEVGDLAVRAVHRRVDDEFDRQRGINFAQPRNDLDRRVARRRPGRPPNGFTSASTASLRVSNTTS